MTSVTGNIRSIWIGFGHLTATQRHLEPSRWTPSRPSFSGLHHHQVYTFIIFTIIISSSSSSSSSSSNNSSTSHISTSTSFIISTEATWTRRSSFLHIYEYNKAAHQGSRGLRRYGLYCSYWVSLLLSGGGLSFSSYRFSRGVVILTSYEFRYF